MTIQVLFFGALRDVAGRADLALELPAGATARQLVEACEGLFPGLAEHSGKVVLARNQKFVRGSEPLTDGDEVALLPPVSGGSVTPFAGSDSAKQYTHWCTEDNLVCGLTREIIDETALLSSLLRGEDGAAVTFLGVVRNNSKGRRTLHLDYSGYEPMAIQVMADLAREIGTKHAVGRVAMVHRLGRLEIGEASVCVMVTSPHRQAAFEACLEGINRLKKTVPIWKKEYFEDGEVWVEGEWDESLRP